MAQTNHEMLSSSIVQSASSTKVISQTNLASKKCLSGFKSPSKTSKKSCSEISFKDFLDFIQTAYQVNDCVEGNVNSIEFDWKSVSSNPLIASILGIKDEEKQKVSEQSCIKNAVEEAKKEMQEISTENKFLSLKKAESTSFEKPKTSSTSVNSETGSGKKVSENKNVEQVLKRKLNEIIQEGLLDSVLPYVVPKQNVCPQAKTSELKTDVSKATVDKLPSQSSKEKTESKKKSSLAAGEVEVEIHVCDEVKNLKRDFRCPQKLLISKMGYFAEVTTGQKLEDMDISVHCDITIFDWLMRWVKKDSTPHDQWPLLDSSNVVPILVSAAFLQMDPLFQDCLSYCQEHMNEIVRASTNLSCLNDNILTRLANLFSNVDVENLRDRKDKIQTRLYCKLITALTDPTPNAARGHFASLASMYKCSKCDRLVLRQLASHILCKPSSMRMDRFGNISAIHTRDPSWNLNDYIRKLHDELKTWRSVYWRLWGDCHFLFCTTCHHYFPVIQTGWCCYHPEQPQFFTMEHQRSMMYPIGRFPCCGERAYRFEVLRNQLGCQFREHTPSLNTEKEVAVHKIFVQHKNLIAQDPPKLIFPERLTKLVSNRAETDKTAVADSHARNNNREILWWEGMELAPPRPRLGLLCRLWDSQSKDSSQLIYHPASECGSIKQIPLNNSTSNVNAQGAHRKQVSPVTDAPVPCDPYSDVTSHYTSDEETSTDGNISEESAGHVRKMRSSPKLRKNKHAHHHGKHRVDGCRQWLANLSIRSNQDNQREYEENLMRQMITILTRRTCGRASTRTCRSTKGHGYYHSSIWNNHITPTGGTYVRLEQEWKESVNHGRNSGTLSRQRSTNSLSARQKLRISR